MSIPVKGEEPGAFVLTSKRDGQIYTMSEKIFRAVLDKLCEENFDTYFTGEWVVLTDEERRLVDDYVRLRNNKGGKR